ncbi:MAG: trypsin-like peptidase domain-containing protein [Actinomycetaceae bacterium]|nr:trypsin-like peptidase domain-containing protein [Actinomycetaceae bacterium]
MSNTDPTRFGHEAYPEGTPSLDNDRGEVSTPEHSRYAPDAAWHPAPEEAGPHESRRTLTQPSVSESGPLTQPLPTDPGAGSNGEIPPLFPPPTTPPTPAQPTPAPRSRRGPGWIGVLFVAILTALATLAASFFLWGPTSLETLGRSGAEVATQAPVEQASAQETNWESVAKAVQPAVVSIQVQTDNGGDTGSGVIFDTKGHVLTNYHVIASALNSQAQLTIQLSDGRLFNGSVVGADSTTDLAVLSITNPPGDLQMVSLGSSTNLRVGQPVAAIGAPLGLDNTMTTGIISALDRPVTVTQKKGNEQNSGPLGIPGLQQQQQGEQVVTNAIQVDAAINPGNSGGPLFAADGSVIGITSSIASLSQGSPDSSGSIGIGFAIPVNLAKTVADQILTTGKAQHAYLGVMVRTAAAKMDDATVAGAEVADVVSGGAAEKAGLAAQDVIIGIDKHTVSSGTALTGFVRWYVPGDKVTITYVREGKKHDIEVTLGTTDEQR